MTNFTNLGLNAALLKALSDEGYTTPTPIQGKAIPSVLEGSDLLGIAQTGTGKTAAFALPILHRLATEKGHAHRKGCRVLVLSPTRELASQIADSFKVYGRHLNLTVTTIFGGVAQRPQIRALANGVDIVVATPGRLLDHIGQRNLNLRHTEILVLDEADQMLDLGFVKPIRQIVSNLPKQRQTLFFSATMPKEITRLANEFLNNPIKVAVTPVASTVDRITQRVIQIEAHKKRALLAQLLAEPDMSRTIVFTRTKRGADRVAKHLEAKRISAAAIHGNKSQNQRERTLEAFKKGKIDVLVATDIAARGIDIDDVTHVVNFELPEVAEAYVHRIGRTARAGASGSAISLCDAAELKLLRAIERLTKQTIPSEDRRNDSELEVEKGSGQRALRGRSGAGGRQARTEGRQARTDGRKARTGGRQTQKDGRKARTDGRQAETTGHRADDRSGTRNRQDARKSARTGNHPGEKQNNPNRTQGASSSNNKNKSPLADIDFMAAPGERSGNNAGKGSAKRNGGGNRNGTGFARRNNNGTKPSGNRNGANRNAGKRNNKRSSQPVSTA